MALIISPNVLHKLAVRHRVTPPEINECFCNRDRGFLIDTREDHQTDPPTQWFVAETDYGRILKVIFIERDDDIYIKSAYVPNQSVIELYLSTAELC